jgi:hypothetical protein
MARSGDDAYWRDLESHAHRPEVQELIRQEIQQGAIRVRPTSDGSNRIVPVGRLKPKNRGDRTQPVPGGDQPIRGTGSLSSPHKPLPVRSCQWANQSPHREPGRP